MKFLSLIATCLLVITGAQAQTPTVAINEFVASNDASAADEAGEFDDWIELFNNTSNAINLSGFTLSDNPDNLEKWAFPEGTVIDANGYLIVWADEDGDMDQGPLHASFKLSAGGEELYLVDPSGDVVDSIVFGEQAVDVAFARVPNGTGDFRAQAPTFGTDNESTSTYDLADLGVKAYPNPAREVLTLEGSGATTHPVTLHAMTGQTLFEGSLGTELRIDISAFVPGNYVLRVGRAAKLISVR